MVVSSNTGEPVFSIVRPPRTAWQQVKVEARRMRGNREVASNYPSPYFTERNKEGGLLGAFRSGASPFNLMVFLTVKIMVRLHMQVARFRRQADHWERDLSSRGT